MILPNVKLSCGRGSWRRLQRLCLAAGLRRQWEQWEGCDLRCGPCAQEQDIRGTAGYERLSPDAQSFWSVLCHGLSHFSRIFLQNMSMFHNVYTPPVLTLFEYRLYDYTVSMSIFYLSHFLPSKVSRLISKTNQWSLPWIRQITSRVCFLEAMWPACGLWPVAWCGLSGLDRIGGSWSDRRKGWTQGMTLAK